MKKEGRRKRRAKSNLFPHFTPAERKNEEEGRGKRNHTHFLILFQPRGRREEQNHTCFTPAERKKEEEEEREARIHTDFLISLQPRGTGK